MRALMTFSVGVTVEIPDEFATKRFHGIKWGEFFAEKARQSGADFSDFSNAEITGVYNPYFEEDEEEIIWEG